MHSEAAFWLDLFNKSPRELVSVFPYEAQKFRKVCRIEPERVIRNSSGEPRILMFSKTKAIETMKRAYGFMSKDEVGKALKDANNS